MLPVFALLACGHKKSTFSWPSENLQYQVVVEYQGAFNASGGAQQDVYQSFTVKLSCQATPTEKKLTPMSCRVDLSSPQSSDVFSGTLDLMWNGHKLHRLDVPNAGTLYTDILYNALGALELPELPEPCEDQNFEGKTPQKIYRIPQLTGPSSMRSKHQLNCSEPSLISQTELTISAMAADNTSAPRFSFVGTDELRLAADGLPQSRTAELVLINSSTALPPRSVSQKIVLTRQ